MKTIGRRSTTTASSTINRLETNLPAPSTSNDLHVQPKTTQVILVQKNPKLYTNKNGETLQQIVLTQPSLAVNVSNANLRSHMSSGGEGIETVTDTSEVYQQTSDVRSASVAYVTNPSGMVHAEQNYVTTAQDDALHGAEDSEQQTQHLSGMDVYPIGQHMNTVNTTYVYTTDYPPYYQYQPIQSPGHQTYIVQQQNSPGSVDEDSGAQLGHTTRASPATIQWLINNYEPADGTSLPRCTLYSHYIKHCNDNKLEPVNAASFGKLIRSVFHGLRTRRLGTRGNSKYHYYGIRIKPDSTLNRGMNSNLSSGEDYVRPSLITTSNSHNLNQMPTRTSSRRTVLGNGTIGRRSNINTFESGNIQRIPNSISPSRNFNSGNQRSSFPSYHNQNSTMFSSNEEKCLEMDREILGDGEVPTVPIPDMHGLENYLQPLGLNLQHALRFIEGYTTNCGEVLECIKQLQFDAVEECWVTFWQPENEQEEIDDDDCLSNDKSSKGLTQIQLFRLCTVPQMQSFVQNMDFAFYQVITDVLIPDVLSCNMSSTLTTQIRNFAKSLEGHMKKAMQGAPDAIQKKKLTAIRMLAHTLRRYTSLNHLASAARGVLQKPDQIQQMFQDFNRVDITNVQDQAGWVCDCDPILVSNLQSDFRDNLQKQKTLEQWAEWMEAVVDQVLAKYHDKPFAILADVSKQFLKNWSFYSSMIIRDLTLRSAQSFGSFHLIRLLYDEYLLYLVELRLAKAANKPIISIMAETSEVLNNHISTPTLTGNQSLANNSINIISHDNQVFHTLDGQHDVNIVYMDEAVGHPHAIHYIDMVSDQMDTLEQIVHSSEVTLEEVKSNMEDRNKDLDII